MAKKVLIIGATGNFGLEVRRYLLENTDYRLTLISRHLNYFNTIPVL